MPYIKKKRRDQLIVLPRGQVATAGELNYVLTQCVLDYIGVQPMYEDINTAVGALECAKLELYRRLAAPYEDKAIERNGDVYDA